MRRGISLIEVLIAMFIACVGLLSVASLIPIGSFQIGESNKAIRGWDLAQFAYREIKVRGILSPEHWVDGGGFNASSPGPCFVIDPQWFARNGSIYPTPITGQAQCWFPFAANEAVNQAGALPYAFQIPRISLRTWTQGPGMFAEPYDDQNANTIHDAGEPYRDLNDNGQWDDPSLLAERLFTGHDDTQFETPEDRQLRPLPIGTSGDIESSGDYSWMATAEAIGYPSESRSYLVSIVVFHKRQLTYNPGAEIPSERTVWIDFLDGVSEGGRHAMLYYTASLPGSTDYLNIKANSWIAVTGFLDAGIPLIDYTTSPPSIPAVSRKKTIRWLRVASAGQPEDDPPVTGQPQVKRRRVSLDGGDIDARIGAANVFVDQNTGTPEPTCHATILPGVVNVFTKTIDLH